MVHSQDRLYPHSSPGPASEDLDLDPHDIRSTSRADQWHLFRDGFLGPASSRVLLSVPDSPIPKHLMDGGDSFQGLLSSSLLSL